MDWTTAFIFWLGAGLLVYVFIGYPLLMFVVSRTVTNKTGKSDAFKPTTSVVLVVRNEGRRVSARIANLLDTEADLENLEIVVVSDGPDAEVEALAEGFAKARRLQNETSRGKAACLNDAVREAKGEIIVFGDARQEFDRQTIPTLVAYFADDVVGAVSGELVIRSAKTGTGAGVDAYWRLEKIIRRGEASVDASIGCTGAVYAIRREDYSELPEDTLIDDVVCPMQIALKGRRVLFEPEAKAFDPQTLDPETEKRRKTRTLAGNFQMLFRYPGWLVPWRNRLWLQLLSHKYLRLAAPVLLVVIFVANVALAQKFTFYKVLLFGQIAFYSLAVVGLLLGSRKLAVFALPAGFLFLNWMTVRGFFYYITHQGRAGW